MRKAYRNKIIVISLICIQIFCGLAISSKTRFSETNPELQNQIFNKIDVRLQAMIYNASVQDEKVGLLIIFKGANSANLPVLPSNVKIVKYFSIINGLKIECPIHVILSLAEMNEIKSIWWDLPIETDISKCDEIVKAAASNFDPTFANFTADIGATDLVKRGYNGSNIVIAVLDAGVDITGSAGGDLDDFDENTNTTDPKYLGAVSMLPEEPLYYTDLNGRGTYHAGIACGTGNINASYVGVAPGAYYLNVKVFDSVGITFWSFIISGIEWAISHSADIIVFGATIPGLYLDPVCLACDAAVDHGVLVVAPVGDDGPGYMSVNTPGQSHKALTVGAYNSFTRDVWNQSSRGPTFDFGVGPDMIAPGVGLIGPRSRIFSVESFDMLNGINDMASQFGYEFNFNLNVDMASFTGSIPTTTFGEDVPGEQNYTRASGTAGAAAVVAGAAAILFGAFPLASPEMIRMALMQTANPITANKDQNAEGMGLINVSAAFNWLEQILPVSEYNVMQMPIPLIYPGVVTTTDIRNVSQYSLMSNPNMYQYDVSALFSTQAMMDAVVLTDSKDPGNSSKMAIHLPLNQFGVEYSLSSQPTKRTFHWFSEFNVIREMHQMMNQHFYQEGYNRYAGVLGMDGLYIVVIAETWSYCGEYNFTQFSPEFFGYQLPFEYQMMNITNRVTAIKMSFDFINDRTDKQTYQNVSFVSFFKADLFVNETGTDMNDPISALNFTKDDVVQFDNTTGLIYVEDWNNDTYAIGNNHSAMGFQSISHPLSKYAIGDSIELLLNITLYNMASSVWNQTKNVTGIADPGFATAYNLTSIPYGKSVNFTGVLGLGYDNTTALARKALYDSIDFITHNVTKYNITDLMVLSVDYNRMGEKNIPYLSNAKVINIGTTTLSNFEVAFMVNRTNENNVLEIYSLIYLVNDFNPFEIRHFNSSWVPLQKGVYVVGWVIGVGSYTELQNEENLLSNALTRTVFVIDGAYYDSLKLTKFFVYPTKLDQAPMKIFAPLDFGIYNLTVTSIRPITNVVISTDGIGKNLIFMNDTYYDILHPYEALFLILIGNPICPPGTNRFNITFTIQGQTTPFYRLPVEITIQPNRGRLWFDAVHLNVFVSDNIVGGFSGLSGITDTSNISLTSSDSNISGSFNQFDNMDLSSSDGFDLTNFIDLNERLDTTWGNFFDLRKLWAQPESNNGKGALLMTMIPFISINVSEYIGIDITSIRLSEMIPATSFLGRTIGDYYFEENVITTNYINHDTLQFFDGLVINDPEQAFLQREITNITSWVEKGGTLFVFAEDKYHNNIPSLNQLLTPYDLKLANTTWYPYSKHGYYTYDLRNEIGQESKNSELFAGSTVNQIAMKDPIKVTSLSSKSYTICNGTIGIANYGAGRVIVIGDNDVFKGLLLNQYDNQKFAQQILKWGMQNYYELNVTATPSTLSLYQQAFVDINITNYYTKVAQKNLTSFGFFFLSAFFYENGTIFNASIYGMKIPVLPMFHTDNSHYATFFDSNWYLAAGDFYVLIIMDHPAAASELIYVHFHVVNGPPPQEINRFVTPDPDYSHIIDIIAVLAIVYMGLVLWTYNLEKYKTRLRITQLKGDYLNIAKTRLNEGKTLIKLLLRGLEKGDVEEIERMRFLLSYRKKLTHYFKDLNDFGNTIGEHY